MTAFWLVLVGATVVWEVGCHRPDSRWTSLTDLGARMGSRRTGQIVLVAGWAFVGWHVFARYTIPS